MQRRLLLPRPGVSRRCDAGSLHRLPATTGAHVQGGIPGDGVIADDAAWQRHWRRLAAQSASWYATPSGAVGHRFTAILEAEWRGVLSRSWNSKRPLVFAHVVLTKTLGVRRAREIRERITRHMDLWGRGQHAGLVGDSEVEGASREGRAAFSIKEEENAMAQSFHETVLSGKIRQAVCWATDREWGGCLLSGDKCTKTGRPVADVLREKHPDMHVPLRKTPRVQPSRSMRMYPKRYPSTSRRITSHGLHRSSPEQQVRWEYRQLSYAIGSFA